MAISDGTAAGRTSLGRQEGTQPDPHRQSPRSDEGGIRLNKPLTNLGRLLEQVLVDRRNDESLEHSRVSRAQRDFHQQKPPTFFNGNASMEADRWLSAVEETFRATAIRGDDLRIMTAPSLFRDEAVR